MESTKSRTDQAMTDAHNFLKKALVAGALLAFSSSRPAAAQDWIKTGTGLGVSQARPLEKTFHGVLWNDLEYSGILDMVSQSFYPMQVPSQPSELNAQQWAAAPANTYMLAYGNMTADGTDLSVA